MRSAATQGEEFEDHGAERGAPVRELLLYRVVSQCVSLQGRGRGNDIRRPRASPHSNGCGAATARHPRVFSSKACGNRAVSNDEPESCLPSAGAADCRTAEPKNRRVFGDSVVAPAATMSHDLVRPVKSERRSWSGARPSTDQAANELSVPCASRLARASVEAWKPGAQGSTAQA